MPQEKKSCLIMMASYNGERFIKEQIESIIELASDYSG